MKLFTEQASHFYKGLILSRQQTSYSNLFANILASKLEQYCDLLMSVLYLPGTHSFHVSPSNK